MSADDKLAADLARLADELGPALVPVTHGAFLRSVTATAMRLFDAAACSIALVDTDGGELVFAAASGQGAEHVEGMRMPVSEGIAGWVVSSGQPIAVGNVQSDPRFARDVAARTGYVPASILAMPLETDDAVLGVISVLDRGPNSAAAADDMELLAALSRQAALAVEHSRVFSALGSALLHALAAGADTEVGERLRHAAQEASGPSAELAELAACFNDLARAGAAERTAAVGLLRELAAYTRATGHRR